MTELEIKQQAVEDAFNTYDAMRSSGCIINFEYSGTAYDAFTKARLELSEYLKEHGDD